MTSLPSFTTPGQRFAYYTRLVKEEQAREQPSSVKLKLWSRLAREAKAEMRANHAAQMAPLMPKGDRL